MKFTLNKSNQIPDSFYVFVLFNTRYSFHLLAVFRHVIYVLYQSEGKDDLNNNEERPTTAHTNQWWALITLSFSFLPFHNPHEIL